MAIDNQIGRATDILFQGNAKPKGVTAASAPGELVEYTQNNDALALKQDIISAGSGIAVESNVVAVDLATSGTDYSSLTLSGATYASLDGEYILAPVSGSFSFGSQQLDFDEGGTYNVYYKDNGSGVWAMLAKRDDDNLYNNGSAYDNIGPWLAVLTTVDVSTLNADYPALIPNYLAVDFDNVTTSSEQTNTGNGAPSSSASGLTYATGSTPAGLKFDNNKLAVDFSDTVGEAASTNIFPASVIKTYVDEQRDFAKNSANNTFSNIVANLTGNPSNVQSAIEAAAAEIDSTNTDISSAATLASSEYAKIATLETEMDAAEAATAQEVTDREADIALVETSLGFAVGQGVQSSGENVTSGASVEEAISELDIALNLVQGDLSSRLPAVDYFHDGATYALTAGQAAGTEAFGAAKYDVINPDTGLVVQTVTNDLTGTSADLTILVSYGAAGDVDAGVYTRDHTTGYLTRATYFDESSEIQKNAIMQVKYGGDIAGAQFYVSTPDAPTVGTDPIGFALASAVIIGAGTVSESKLSPSLSAKLNAKVDYEVSTNVTIPANTNGSTYLSVATAFSTILHVTVDMPDGEQTEGIEIVKKTGEIRIGSGSELTGMTVNVTGVS